MIDAPALGERWIGAAGHPTTLNGTTCATSSVSELGAATLYSTTPDMFSAGEMVGGLFYFNYPGGTGLMAGAVFGRIAGESAGRASRRNN